MKKIRNIILLMIIMIMCCGINTENVDAMNHQIESGGNHFFYNIDVVNTLVNKRFIPVDDSDGGGGSVDDSVECSALLDDELIDWISTAFFAVQIGAVILVIVLGMIDFGKATISSDDGAIKKTWNKFAKRLIALIILLILPEVVQFILSLVDVPGLTEANPLCE